MSREPVTVLLTCAGSPLATEMILGLSQNETVPTRIVGVDIDGQGVGREYAAAFYAVPPGNDPAYPNRLLEICRKEQVRIVIPTSDEEALALARVAEEFRAQGVICTVPRRELIEAFASKPVMYRYLAERGVEVPRHVTVRSADDLRDAARLLGYPQRPFIVKPATARGGRGVWLVRAGGSSLDELLKGVSLDAISLETLLGAIARGGELPPLLAMEYLSGSVFDVDILAKDGIQLYLIARRRFHPRTTPFRGCVLERHDGVLSLAYQIHEALSLNYLHDVDIMLGEDGVPRLLEVNPRLSGSVIATISAGLNLLEFLVRMVLGLEVPTVEVPYGRVIRPSVRTTCLNGTLR